MRGTYKPEAEDAEIEEIKEENENLNLSDLSKQMIEKALEKQRKPQESGRRTGNLRQNSVQKD